LDNTESEGFFDNLPAGIKEQLALVKYVTSGVKAESRSLMHRAVNPNNPESKAKLSEEIIA